MSAGRIRSIKPETLDDEIAVALSDGAWRMWISLRCVADDYGNCRFGDRYLAATVWQNTAREVSRERDELVTAGKVRAYIVDGQRYGHLTGWEREQRIDNAGKPRVPGPDDAGATSDRALSRRFAESLGEPPRVAESLGGSPLDPDPDHRPPTPINDPRSTTASTNTTEDVDAVWSHYVTVCKRWKPRARITKIGDKDRRSIRAHLKAGLTVPDLRLAIDGLFASAFHRDGGHIALRYALRDENVTRFIEAAEREQVALAGASPTPVDAASAEERGEIIDTPLLDFSALRRGA